MIRATRRLEWDAAHRVLRHESKCGTLHGHRYVAEITIEAPQLDDVGRVIDFGAVKERVGRWIDDHWDHTTLVNAEDSSLRIFCVEEHRVAGKKRPFLFDSEPTAENIAAKLLDVSQDLLGGDLRVTKVRVYETPNCYAEAFA